MSHNATPSPSPGNAALAPSPSNATPSPSPSNDSSHGEQEIAAELAASGISRHVLSELKESTRTRRRRQYNTNASARAIHASPYPRSAISASRETPPVSKKIVAKKKKTGTKFSPLPTEVAFPETISSESPQLIPQAESPSPSNAPDQGLTIGNPPPMLDEDEEMADSQEVETQLANGSNDEEEHGNRRKNKRVRINSTLLEHIPNIWPIAPD
ncbi:hypothetical protein K474DRAFT_1714217 [Panus rudis PR-1116 ss-1]|nr:hypothetical protein K474DRAFT_1714217 [Panus rudis PR-1116 ss-1]